MKLCKDCEYMDKDTTNCWNPEYGETTYDYVYGAHTTNFFKAIVCRSMDCKCTTAGRGFSAINSKPASKDPLGKFINYERL